jgi:hypothetical protein
MISPCYEQKSYRQPSPDERRSVVEEEDPDASSLTVRTDSDPSFVSGRDLRDPRIGPQSDSVSNRVLEQRRKQKDRHESIH